MSNSDQHVWLYLLLAEFSRQKSQLGTADRFLLLAGAQALQSGWLQIAEQCRDLVLRHNPHHLIHQYENFPTALRDPEFTPFLRQLTAFCPAEHAEVLVQDQGVSLKDWSPDNGREEAEVILRRLSAD